jgi:hypothetical protein
MRAILEELKPISSVAKAIYMSTSNKKADAPRRIGPNKTD